MNRLLVNFPLALCLLSAPALVMAHDPDSSNTPNCDALDRNYGDHIEIDSDVDFEKGELIFRENGDVYMIITEDDELFIKGERIELDARGRELVGKYYDTVDDVVDDAMDIAGEAADLGISAAIQALALIFSDEKEREEFEARIEEEAQEIEAMADSMCSHLRVIEDIEIELQRIVPEFEPRMYLGDH